LNFLLVDANEMNRIRKPLLTIRGECNTGPLGGTSGEKLLTLNKANYAASFRNTFL
jgi:hypothetical protein